MHNVQIPKSETELEIRNGSHFAFLFSFRYTNSHLFISNELSQPCTLLKADNTRPLKKGAQLKKLIGVLPILKMVFQYEGLKFVILK